MALQLLKYPLTSQNQRVSDQGGLTSELNRATFPSRGDRSAQIEKAYRQIFFHAMKCDRDVNLESQFLDGGITTRDFIRGLLLSGGFRKAMSPATTTTDSSIRSWDACWGVRFTAKTSGSVGQL